MLWDKLSKETQDSESLFLLKKNQLISYTMCMTRIILFNLSDNIYTIYYNLIMLNQSHIVIILLPSVELS